MIKEKLKRGTLAYQLYLYYHLFFRYRLFYKKKNNSQFDEDLFLLEFYKKKVDGKFVDLGAYHPMKYNNTYLLYKLGWRGINIDLNQTSIDMFNIVRKEDTNICTLISDEAENEKTIYFEHNFSAVSSLNFSEGLNKKMIMKTNKFDNIVKDKFDFLNIDLEDHDYQVLKTIDLNRYQPSLICIEILEGSRNKENIYDFMKKNKYRFLHKCHISYFFKREEKI